MDDGCSVEECVAYVMEELCVSEPRGLDIVLTIKKRKDDMISAMTVCVMMEKIKKM